MARPNIALSARLVCHGQPRLFGVTTEVGRLRSPRHHAYEVYERRISGVQRWDPVKVETLDPPTLEKLGILGDAAHALDGVDAVRTTCPHLD
jgi:hypothetical protein